MDWERFGYCALTVIWAVVASQFFADVAKKEHIRDRWWPLFCGFFFQTFAIWFLYRAIGGPP